MPVPVPVLTAIYLFYSSTFMHWEEKTLVLATNFLFKSSQMLVHMMSTGMLPNGHCVLNNAQEVSVL